MGLGAALVLTSFAMLFALGLAGFGCFKGDPFVAASVVAVTTLVAVFTFFPVARILVSALQDAGGAFSLTADSRAPFHAEDLGPGLHRRQHPLRRRVEHARARVPLRRGLHRARSRFRADRHAYRLQVQEGRCAFSRSCRSSRRRS
jgi:hypothetical protein